MLVLRIPVNHLLGLRTCLDGFIDNLLEGYSAIAGWGFHGGFVVTKMCRISLEVSLHF